MSNPPDPILPAPARIQKTSKGAISRTDAAELAGAVSNAPKLSTGDDKAIAKELTKRFTEAQNGMRRIVALGLLAIEIKGAKLTHGQFGPWLAVHAPKLARLDSTTGKAKASTALSSYIALTSGVLETVGLNEKKYCELVSNSREAGIWQGGKLLLLADKKVPEAMRPLREKICAMVDGKTRKQVQMEFVQMEDDADGNLKTNKGGGFRPPAADVQEWLKANHADQAGTKYSDLPEKLQRAFKKQFRPKAPPAEFIAESKRAQMQATFDQLSEDLQDKIFMHCDEKFRRQFDGLLKDYRDALSATFKPNKKDDHE